MSNILSISRQKITDLDGGESGPLFTFSVPEQNHG